MQIHLQELSHQQQAIQAILNSMPPLKEAKQETEYANPLLQGAGDKKNFIDIKMETGTGKTYVYTRAMYELNKAYGLYKFIIVVPTLPIKAGTQNFIKSDYARHHFAQFFNAKIDLTVLNAGDFDGKKNRKIIPNAITNFCNNTIYNKNSIQCLLINIGMLNNKKGLYESYDQTVLGGFSCPAEGLAATRPIVIIDEPHKVKQEDKAYQNIITHLKPQLIMRFGATFPLKKDKKTDYYRGKSQYDLTALQAFNQDLVKGVAVHFPNIKEGIAVYKVKNEASKELVLGRDGKEWTLRAGDPLSNVDSDFGHLTFVGANKLSNDLQLAKGMVLVASIFDNSYQELLLKQALQSHFEQEKVNFHRHIKVKTNALFFIEDIESYRQPEGWLKTTFEWLLKEECEALLQEYSEGDYCEFLKATLANFDEAHGGYFAQDNKNEEYQAEIADILDKGRSLSYTKTDGKPNIRRFFFSKWTLKEGWDNPNVFTICKLRSSGSETSKLQEVGRGLRLPVDENGNRLAGEEWQLNYIIGYDEKEFAHKLIDDINQDVGFNTTTLTDAMIEQIAFHYKIDKGILVNSLGEKGIIDFNKNFKEGGFERLLALYPALEGLKKGKITTNEKSVKVKLNLENWNKIKAVWQKISSRYMVTFKRLGNKEIEQLLAEVLQTPDCFDEGKAVGITTFSTFKKGEEIVLTEQTSFMASNSPTGMAYHTFVKKLAYQTYIPISIVHKQLWLFLSKNQNTLLTYKTLAKIINLWQQKFNEKFDKSYSYNPLNFMAETSILKGNSFVQEIEAGLIGVNKADSGSLQSLYEGDSLYYDSNIEKDILEVKPPQIVRIFGKIPRRAIQVPLYTGGSSTPDFIFTTERGLTLLVEAKSTDPRGSEERAVEAQNHFFKQIKGVNWAKITSMNELETELQNIIK